MWRGIFFTWALSWACYIPCSSQPAALPRPELSIPEVLQKIVHRGYEVAYSPELFRHMPKIQPGMSLDAPVEGLLKDCFAGLRVGVLIKGRTIILFRTGDTLSSIYSNLSGWVVDRDKKALEGATVTVPGSTISVCTDAAGYFSLPVRAFLTRVAITHTGYAMRTLDLSNKQRNVVEMQPVIEGLDAVMVQAYGVTTSRFNTGSVFVMRGDEALQSSAGNILDGLSGLAPGLLVRQLNGVPGSAYTATIGGQHSIQQGNDPLYVLDGVPLMEGGFLSLIGSGSAQGVMGASPLNFIPPDAVASVTVLKDAAAVSIYGSRASNGVVLLTLRSAQASALHVTADVSAGVGRVVKTSPLLSTPQFLQLRKEAVTNDGMRPDSLTVPEAYLWDSTRQSNYKRLTTGGAEVVENAGVTVSGGSGETSFLVYGRVYRESTVYPGHTPDERRSAYGHLNNRLDNGRIQLNLSALYTSEGNQLPVSDYTPFQYLAPNAPSFNIAGQPQWGAFPLSFVNIPALANNPYTGNVNTFFAHLQISYHPDEHFSLEESLGYNGILSDERSVTTLAGQDPNSLPPPTGSIITANNRYSGIITETIGRWSGKAGPGQLDGLLGVDWQGQQTFSSWVSTSGYPSDFSLEQGIGATQYVPEQNDVYYRYAAAFGRANYNIANQYLFTSSWRRDGSSRFGPGNQYGNFWAMGGAWIFSESRWLRNSKVLSFGKLRGSYGTTGNDLIGDNQFEEVYNFFQGPVYQGQQGVVPVTLANTHFRWELNYRTELAIELGSLGNKVFLSATAYRNWTGNQVVGTNVAPTAGLPGLLSNQPIEVVNEGFEFAVQTRSIQIGQLSWGSLFTLTMPRNILARWPGLAISQWATTYTVGRSITAVKAYHLLGVNPQSGIYTFQTSNPNGIPGVNDLVPDAGLDQQLYGGLSNYLKWGNWGLDFQFDYRVQRGLNPLMAMDQNNPPGMQGVSQLSNGPVEWLDHWRKPGDRSPQQRLTSTYGSAAGAALFEYLSSDAWSIDASFIRLKSMELSYQIPKNRLKGLGLSDCRWYLRGRNLWTITRFPVTDPETQNPNVLPPVRVVVGGVKISF